MNYSNRRTSLSTMVHPTAPAPVRLTMERTTQTERRVPKWRLLLYCLMGDDQFRRQRQREAAGALGTLLSSFLATHDNKCIKLLSF